MAVSIKNDETHELIRQLARLTGESQTEAVTQAVRERLARLRHQHERPLSERLVAIGEDCAARLKEPYRSADHGDLLYGEDGLPR
jgi:antitoxin VapB